MLYHDGKNGRLLKRSMYGLSVGTKRKERWRGVPHLQRVKVNIDAKGRGESGGIESGGGRGDREGEEGGGFDAAQQEKKRGIGIDKAACGINGGGGMGTGFDPVGAGAAHVPVAGVGQESCFRVA